MDGKKSLKLTMGEISAACSDGAGKQYPPILTTQQAAELVGVPIGTIYAWSSQGRLKGCARKVGKHLRFFRDRLISRIFNEDF